MRQTRALSKVAVGFVLAVGTLAGTLATFGGGSLEVGAARLLKSGIHWALGFRGPVLEFWGHPVVGVEADDTRAYAGGAFEIVIFDIVPGALRRAGQVAVGGIVHNLAARGDMLYAATGDGGLAVVDVATPAHPELVQELPSFGYTFGVALCGDRLLTAERTGGVRVFDLTNGRTPRQLASFHDGRATNDVTASKDCGQVYVADGERGLLVLRLSRSGSLTELASLAIPAAAGQRPARADAPPLKIQERDGLVYLAAADRGLLLVDVRDPRAPRLLSQLELPGETVDVRLHDSEALLAQEPEGLAVVDVSDPSKLSVSQLLKLPGCVHSVALAGSHVIAGLVGQGLALLDGSTQLHLSLVSHYVPDAEARNVAVSGKQAYLAQGSGGLEIYDLSERTRPRLIAHRATRDFVHDIAVQPPFAYLAEDEIGAAVLDISDPVHPRDVATRKTPEHALGVAVHGPRLFTAEGSYGFAELDVADPQLPRLLRTGPQEGYTFAVEMAGQRLAVADFFGGLRLLDVGAGGNPVTWQGPRRVLGMAADGNTLFVGQADGMLQAVDVTPSRPPSVISRQTLPGTVVGVSVRDGLVAAAGLEDGVWLVDAHAPAGMRLLGGVRTRGRAWGVALEEGLLYVADGAAGLTVVDTTDPAHLRVLPAP
jgi:hypothetical protein